VGFLWINVWETAATPSRWRPVDVPSPPCAWHHRAVRLLLPPPGLVTDAHDEFDRSDAAALDRLYGTPRPTRGRRPWVGLCMIASLDGSTARNGISGGLGNDGDRAVFSALRRAADAILVGAATARAEQYRAPRREGQRIGVVTSTGSVDRSTDLFPSGAGFLVMPDDGPPAPDGIDVVRAGVGRVDVALAVRRLGDVMDAPTFVQVEGGPRLNGALVDADCVDELNLSFAPMLVGGDGSRLVAGAAETDRRFGLAHVIADDDGYLFTRWVRRTP
jgi:riboflavin biosynthesis pyrimidine reductase